MVEVKVKSQKNLLQELLEVKCINEKKQAIIILIKKYLKLIKF
jgi:hypothetical protein